MDASAYILESLVQPQAYLVSGFAPLMPSPGVLTEIDQVTAFLLTRK